MSISCREAVDYISRLEENKIPGEQRQLLQAHFLECPRCIEFNSFNTLLIKMLKDDLSVKVKLNIDDKEIIIKALKGI